MHQECRFKGYLVHYSKERFTNMRIIESNVVETAMINSFGGRDNPSKSVATGEAIKQVQNDIQPSWNVCEGGMLNVQSSHAFVQANSGTGSAYANLVGCGLYQSNAAMIATNNGQHALILGAMWVFQFSATPHDPSVAVLSEFGLHRTNGGNTVITLDCKEITDPGTTYIHYHTIRNVYLPPDSNFVHRVRRYDGNNMVAGIMQWSVGAIIKGVNSPLPQFA
jgi:hypothetical protein